MLDGPCECPPSPCSPVCALVWELREEGEAGRPRQGGEVPAESSCSCAAHVAWCSGLGSAGLWARKVPYFAVYKVLPFVMRTHVFGPNFQEKSLLIFLFSFYLFIFRNKTDDHIPGYYFVSGYRYCFLELHLQHGGINKRIKNIYKDTELVLPMYNMHPYFSLQISGKKVHHIRHNTVVFHVL